MKMDEISARKTGRKAVAPLLVGLAVAGLLSSCGGEPETQEAPVQQIAYEGLPLGPDELPPGPGREAVLNACLLCHSPAYLTMQPPFPRAVWEGVVQKMVQTYGAQVRPYDRKLVVDYLMSIRGVPAKKGEVKKDT